MKDLDQMLENLDFLMDYELSNSELPIEDLEFIELESSEDIDENIDEENH